MQDVSDCIFISMAKVHPCPLLQLYGLFESRGQAGYTGLPQKFTSSYEFADISEEEEEIHHNADRLSSGSCYKSWLVLSLAYHPSLPGISLELVAVFNLVI